MNPKSVAVISGNPEKAGLLILKNMLYFGFEDKVLLVDFSSNGTKSYLKKI